MAKTTQALATTTSHEWLEIYNPKDVIRSLRGVTTITDALDANTPSLALLKKEKGEKYMLGHIKLWLIYLQANLNIKNKLTEDMIDLAAEAIFEDFWYLDIASVKIVFLRALKGHYGEFYESISIPKVISWFREYSEERMEVCEARSINDHTIVKNESPDIDLVKELKKHRDER